MMKGGKGKEMGDICNTPNNKIFQKLTLKKHNWVLLF